MKGRVGSVWEDLSSPGPACPSLTGTAAADVVIVGAGLLGLSSALHAARAGLSVILLEAETAGFGASGRNTGFVVPSLRPEMSPSAVERKLGERHAGRLLRLVAGSGDTVRRLVVENRLDCGFEQTGWLQPAHCATAEADLRGRVAALRGSGLDVAFVERDEMVALTGIRGLHGGLRVASGGQINPLAYARGLAGACIAAGVRIFAQSPAVAIARIAGTWHVRTPDGEAAAPRVLMTTNAMIGNLLPTLRDSIVPVRLFQIATNRLPAELRTRILPANSPVADTRRHTFALRWSPDGRLITGGMVAFGPGRDRRAKARFTARIRRFVPEVGAIRAEYVWSGTIAATLDALPRLMQLDDGLLAAIGCNGRGVALTSTLGEAIGDLLGGRTEQKDFVLPITGPRRIPFGRWSGIGPHLWLPLSDFRDDREARSNG